MRIGYFCTAGYTEMGGIKQFLAKIRADVEWERCFPAVEKPAPKLNRPFPEPRREDSGATGQDLVDRMLERLRKYHSGIQCNLDIVLLIDDADCRFKDSPGSFSRWVARCRERVREATQKEAVEFVALLASPEIEAWLLTDWEEGFGREYHGLEPLLLHHLEANLLGTRPWAAIEDYGGQATGGSCEEKLSEDIQKAFSDLIAAALAGSIDEATCFYSKAVHGPRMLQRIRPDELCAACSRYFAPAYNDLLALPAAIPPSSASNVAEEAVATQKRRREPAAGRGRMRPKPRRR